jgi:hypothetical protein
MPSNGRQDKAGGTIATQAANIKSSNLTRMRDGSESSRGRVVSMGRVASDGESVMVGSKAGTHPTGTAGRGHKTNQKTNMIAEFFSQDTNEKSVKASFFIIIRLK